MQLNPVSVNGIGGELVEHPQQNVRNRGPTMGMKTLGTTVSVRWGNDVSVSIRLTPRNWAKIKVGKPLNIRGKGSYYEGEFFWDYWDFGGGLDGSLTVAYVEGGEDAGTGFDGNLNDAEIEEHRETETACQSVKRI
jgi:hypothetical protein